MFSRVHLNEAVVCGCPLWLDTFGMEEVANVSDVRTIEGTSYAPLTLFPTSEPFRSVLFLAGRYAGTMQGFDTNFSLESRSDVPVYNTLTVLNDARLSNIRTVRLFERADGTVAASGIRISWTIPDVPDYNYVKIFWDGGDSGLDPEDFLMLVQIFNRTSTEFLQTDLTTDTYRFYIVFGDVYGNEGDILTPDVLSISVLQEPTLDGAFSFVDNVVTFTPTSFSNVVTYKLFLNYAFGLGVVDWLNYNYPFRVQTTPSNPISGTLPIGVIKISAVGYDVYGNPTVPIIVTKHVTDVDTFDFIQAPLNPFSQTLSGKRFSIFFSDPNVSTIWTTGYVVILDADGNALEEFTFSPVADQTDYEVTFTSTLDDGSYFFQVFLTNADTVADRNDPLDLIIDGTYPPGSDSFNLEVV